LWWGNDTTRWGSESLSASHWTGSPPGAGPGLLHHLCPRFSTRFDNQDYAVNVGAGRKDGRREEETESRDGKKWKGGRERDGEKEGRGKRRKKEGRRTGKAGKEEGREEMRSSLCVEKEGKYRKVKKEKKTCNSSHYSQSRVLRPLSHVFAYFLGQAT
jgi:hypothetical protein